MAHTPVKPQKIAATAAVALEEALVVPATFQREGIDQFKGAENDTINITVEGVLPFRTYGWRNDRSQPIQFDEYAERKIAVSFGGNIYSAVKLTDEQNDFDFNGWAKLMAKQTEAVGRGLEREAVTTLLNAPYNVTLGGAVAARPKLRATLIRAREVLNRFRVPSAGRVMLIGSGWESALLNDPDLNLASNVGDGEAVSALREATIGRKYGFNFVASSELPPDMAVAMVPSAFIFLTGAPTVPQSAPFGSTASHNGVALRWVRDYDPNFMQDRSVVNTYKGFRHVTDPLIGINAGTSQAYVSQYEHFVRAIKLDLDMTTDILPDADGGPGSTPQGIELAAITGIGVNDGPSA